MSERCAVCFTLCDKSCGNCKKVSYCCVEHQKFHRKKHKADCYPAIEKQNYNKGRFLVATRDIKPLEIIWIEKPIMVAPCGYLPSMYPICLGCCKVFHGEFLKGHPTCSICTWPLCNPVCKYAHWHLNFECKVFKDNQVEPSKFGQPYTYLFIKVLRIVLLKRINLAMWNKMISLKSPTGYKTKDIAHTVVFDGTVDFIRNVCQVRERTGLIEQIFGVFKTHSYSAYLSDTSANSSFFGKICCTQIFEKGCKLSHNCRPNTVTISDKDGFSQRTYATDDIKTGDTFYQIFRYDASQMTFPGSFERRQMLFDRYNFKCKCVMCSDPAEDGTFYSAIKCINLVDKKQCPGYFLPCVTNKHSDVFVNEKWQCNFQKCKSTQKYSVLSKTVDTIKAEINEAKFLQDKLNLIAKHENTTVHENHFLLTKLRFDTLKTLYHNIWALNQCDKRTECSVMAEIMKNYAVKCMAVAEKFHPGLSILRGIILFYIVSGSLSNEYINKVSNMPNADLEEIFKMRDEAKKILCVLPEESYENCLYKALCQI